MMRKITALLLSILMIFCMAGCSNTEDEQPEEQVNYEIAMVTDAGLIMDGGYSEVAWKAITEFGTKNGISHKYYKAAEASQNAYVDTIANAVEKGAKVVIADGHAFEDVVYDAQKKYKNVKFVLIDVQPVDSKNHNVKIAANTTTIMFASEQAGYFAGYAAVKEGFTELGFMGDEKNHVIEDYCLGFVQGADSAAQEYGVQVNVKCCYANNEIDNDVIAKKAKNWYKDGTQVIFACGSIVEQPVIEAAEIQDKKVIGYETDKSAMSDTVITSAIKDFTGALETVLDEYLDDKFPGGEVISYDASNEGVGIEFKNARFNNLDQGDYKSEMQAVAEGNITVKNSQRSTLDSLDLMYVNIEKAD